VNFKYFVDHRNILDSWSIAGLDNNGSALLFAMVIPLCYFAFEAGRGWFRWVFLLCIPLVLHAVMLSFSRGAMLTAGFGGALIYLRGRNKKFLTVLYGLAVVMVIASSGPELQKRFLSISKTDADDSAKSRLTTWKIAFKMMSERPVFGYGIRNSPLLTLSYGADMEGRAIHSQYLQTGADSGVVALLLYLALLASVIRNLWWVRRTLRIWKDPDTDRARSMVSGLECGILCFCVGAFFLSLEHFEMPYILMLLALQLYAITKAIEANTDPRLLAALSAAQQSDATLPQAGPYPQPVPS
jgi:probable O-glycosylation ligase (exosortase A-associated)